VSWWEVILEVVLLVVLIWASYTAGRIDLVARFVVMLDEWAEQRRKKLS
jgi:hypothetical protein